MYDVAIMQPTYLPWAGYFNLISQVKNFVFLDDVQFSKSSWQSRNRINQFGIIQWISLPVRHESFQQINHVMIRREAKWPKKHLQQLQSVYGKAPFFHDLEAVMECLESTERKSLSMVNIELIKTLSQLLELQCDFHKSSTIQTTPDRGLRLLDLIKFCGGGSYLSPEGSREYLEQDGVLVESGVRVIYQDFTPVQYKQFKSQEWNSHLSIIDVIANIGLVAAKDYVRGVWHGL